MEGPHCNIADVLDRQAEDIPDNTALYEPDGDGYKSVSFRGLRDESNRLASGLHQLGIARGAKVLLMVPPGIEFTALAFALFKLGALPVLIDPGLGRSNMLSAIEEVEPTAMIAVPLAHAARMVFPKPFKKIRIAVTVGRRWFWGGKTLDDVRKAGNPGFAAPPTGADDPAAILFTSGSTGPAKGVLYTHGMFTRQVELIKDHYSIRQGEVELPTFPLFALFGTGMGMTCVIPRMDPTRPARVDPENIVRAVREFKVESSFGSPALWNTVSRYCQERNIQLPTIKRILMAGAPVPGTLLKRFDGILDASAAIHTPYGATEALPVASIDRREILGETWDKTREGLGTCVGRPVPGAAVRIIRIDDGPIAEWDGNLELPRGEIGEITVAAPWVTREYFNKERATALAKIRDGGGFWHRMGDVGYLDDRGRLWFCGRKNQRVTAPGGDLFTIPCEAIFNRHPDVRRSALVGVGPCGAQRPVIVIEPENKKRVASEGERETFRQELLELGAGYKITREIREIRFHPEFPVDARHNAKIFRERLAQWVKRDFR
ncbi:MAG: AMP-binding protein [Nitrospinae bacterium]|nr:AMP-binding protein [Nitrospinota bacterium]